MPPGTLRWAFRRGGHGGSILGQCSGQAGSQQVSHVERLANRMVGQAQPSLDRRHLRQHCLDETRGDDTVGRHGEFVGELLGTGRNEGGQRLVAVVLVRVERQCADFVPGVADDSVWVDREPGLSRRAQDVVVVQVACRTTRSVADVRVGVSVRWRGPRVAAATVRCRGGSPGRCRMPWPGSGHRAARSLVEAARAGG